MKRRRQPKTRTLSIDYQNMSDYDDDLRPFKGYLKHEHEARLESNKSNRVNIATLDFALHEPKYLTTDTLPPGRTMLKSSLLGPTGVEKQNPTEPSQHCKWGRGSAERQRKYCS